MRQRPIDFRHTTISVTGILLVNLGTPEAPTPAAVRRYLKEFLWDPRVVEIPRPLWWIILHALVLTTRPARSARAYAKIWTENGSPLLYHSLRQRDALQQELQQRIAGPVVVATGMRYGKPTIATGLEELCAAHADRILVFPLYPQYSAASTATAFDAVAATLKHWRRVPELRFIAQYHDHAAYIRALANSIRRFWEAGEKPAQLLFSFHGMPRRTLLAGDPYHCQCQKTARLVAQQLELRDDEWSVAFQSLFGREEWLRPYASEKLERLGREGLESIDIVCPGFSADCLETLEEMALQNKTAFQESGGGRYRYIPALNATPDHIEALADIVLQHVRGWPAIDAWNAEDAAREAAERERRAREMGA